MVYLFRNRFILTILGSGLLIQIGIWVRNYGVLLYVMDQTHGSAFAVSMISVAEFAPIFVFSFIGGTFADRWRPKRTMIWCDFLSALSILVVLVALVVGSWRIIFFATFASSILSQFSQPSGMRLFKLHVPDELMQAGMSIYQTLFAVFMIIGPMIGTYIYQHHGIHVAIAITAVSFLCSAAVLTLLPGDGALERQGPPSSLRSDMREGLRYVWQHRLLRDLGAAFLLAGLGLGLIQPLGIFIITQRLGLNESYLQWLMAANGAAMIIGGVLAMAFAKRILPQWLLLMGMMVSVITIAALGLSTHLWLSLAAQFLSGLFMPGLQIGINTMILENTDESYIGRVNGILNPLFMGGMVLTMTVSGALKASTSLPVVYLISSALFVFGCIALSAHVKVRNQSQPEGLAS